MSAAARVGARAGEPAVAVVVAAAARALAARGPVAMARLSVGAAGATGAGMEPEAEGSGRRHSRHWVWSFHHLARSQPKALRRTAPARRISTWVRSAIYHNGQPAAIFDETIAGFY